MTFIHTCSDARFHCFLRLSVAALTLLRDAILTEKVMRLPQVQIILYALDLQWLPSYIPASG